MGFIKVRLPKCVVYLKESEIQEMLLQNASIYREALIRGKAFTRAQGKKEQYAKKWSKTESQTLDDLMQ